MGLSDFGRPQGYLERQVGALVQAVGGQRDRAHWPRSTNSFAGCGGRFPSSSEATIVHGDYRLGNMALDPEDPGHVRAIFDWEMATLGDPLADLGYTLIYWTESGDVPARRRGSFPRLRRTRGSTASAEIVEAYAKASGRDVDSIDFYQVLALYKLAVISEGIYKRFTLGKTLGKEFQGMVRATQALAARALAIADASHDPRLRG